MLLSDFFKDAPSIEINQLSTDSRMPMKDSLFFCIKGIRDDGHEFIGEAIRNGAVAIVYEDDIKTDFNAVFIKVNNVYDALNQVAAKFYRYPCRHMETYITCGCYGASSVSSIIYNLLNNYKKSGYIGIYGIKYDDKKLLSSAATLSILENQRQTFFMTEHDVKACCFEASPLSLSYKKLDAVEPDVFIYTCTYKESRNYKEMSRNYYDAVRRYFYALDEDTTIILNRDDLAYDELKNYASNNVLTYGFNEDADFLIGDLILNKDGLNFSIKYKESKHLFSSKMIGISNIYNLVAAISALVSKGYDIDDLIPKVKELRPLEGVLDRLCFGQGYEVIIDCALNNESIKEIFEYAKYITKDNKRIIALMGVLEDDENKINSFINLADTYLDLLILTEDDNSDGLISSRAEMIVDNLKTNAYFIENRINAIELAIETINDGDTLLILGKGNENFIINPLGKEYYRGDYYYAKKYICERMEE